MVRFLQQSKNPMSQQDLRVLGREVGWGLRGWWDISALPLLAGQTMHYFLCLGGDLNLGSNGGEAPRGGGERSRKGSIGVS